MGHAMLNHCIPVKTIDGHPTNTELQNISMDYVINAYLKEDGMEMPEGGLYDPQYSGMTWLQVYRLLNRLERDKKPSKQPWGGDVGEMQGKDGSEPSKAEIEQAKAENDQRVMLAASNAKSVGKLSGKLEELINKMRRSEVDWRDVFNRFIGGDQPDDYTFRRCNKKVYYTQGIYMPAVDKIGVGDVVVAVDTSGSVGTVELQQFLGELNNMSEDHKPRSLTVITCDSEIQSVETYGQGDIVDKIECKGRGGTRVKPVFDYIEDNCLPVDNFVYLTDMGIFDFPKTAPDYPVLWVSTDERCNDAPFGETTRIEVAA
ncbi:MAG: hypothetical protein CL857_02500 [Cryomorphaceae bacterium]|nr:hypothetical protein [Cryomorphaceae bacterium]